MLKKPWIHVATAPGDIKDDPEELKDYFEGMVATFEKYGTRWIVYGGKLYRRVTAADIAHAEINPSFAAWFVRRPGAEARDKPGDET
jgi:hypothetical protein